MTMLKTKNNRPALCRLGTTPVEIAADGSCPIHGPAGGCADYSAYLVAQWGEIHAAASVAAASTWWILIVGEQHDDLYTGPYPNEEVAWKALAHSSVIDGFTTEDCVDDALVTHDELPRDENGAISKSIDLHVMDPHDPNFFGNLADVDPKRAFCAQCGIELVYVDEQAHHLDPAVPYGFDAVADLEHAGFTLPDGFTITQRPVRR